MKNSVSISRIAVVALVSGIISINLSSCSKNDEIQPATTTIITPGAQEKPGTTVPISTSPFVNPAKYAQENAKEGLLLLITHQAELKEGRYMIEVYDDGTVKFQGNKSTAVREQTRKLDILDMKLLRRTFENNKFESLKPTYGGIPGLTTSPQSNIGFRTCDTKGCDDYKFVKVFGGAPDDLGDIMKSLDSILRLKSLVGSQAFPEISRD